MSISYRGGRRGLVLVFAIALSLCFAGGAWAASAISTQGSIYGHTQPAPNQTVTITNTGTGLTRTTNVGASGQFSFAAVPSGSYTVVLQRDGQTVATQNGVYVTAGVGSSVNFARQQAQNLGSITVTGNHVNPIDVTSTGTSLNVNAPQLNRLPVTRDLFHVALLAPSVVPSGVFDAPSFGGASSGENAYFVNGLNVTDDRNFLTLAEPPFETLQTFEIKTGGISAAYGNALGGVINAETKRGTNTYHAGFNVYWQPRGARQNSPDTVVLKNGLATQVINRFSDDSEMNLRYNLWGSGPIIKDHLFFYALAQKTVDHHTYSASPNGFLDGDPGLENQEDQDAPLGLLRLDWDINSANTLSVTGWKTTFDVDGTQFNLNESPSNPQFVSRGSELGGYTLTRGSRVGMAKYTFAPTSNFNISALYGYVRFDTGSNSANPDCPVAIDDRQGLGLHIGCWVLGSVSPGRTDSRHEYRIDAEWLSGNGPGLASGHDITVGYDHDDFSSGGILHDSGPVVDGIPGIEWDYEAVPTTGIVNGVCYPTGNPIPASGQCPGNFAGKFFASGRQFLDQGSFEVLDKSWYIEDNWQIVQNLRLQLGARSVHFVNFNRSGQSFIDDTETTPRLGFSWDVNGDSTFKVFGSYSQYFIPVASNTNIRAAGGELDKLNLDFPVQGIDPVTGAPIGLGTKLGPTQFQGTGEEPDPRTVADQNLKPMSEKEYILGFQKAFNENWTYGVRFIRRWLVDGEDDVCAFVSSPPFKPDLADFLTKQFGPGAAASALGNGSLNGNIGGTGCEITNPGNDISTFADVNGDGQLQSITIPNSALGNIPTARRYYNAIEITISRAFSDNWLFGASYTLSHNYGNEEGYVLSSIDQTDAGLTQSFDFAGLEQGATGDLANDHRHVFKTWGAYQVTPNWRFGGNLLIMSGAPLSCLGTFPDAVNIATFYGSFSHYCGAPPGPTATFPNGATLVPQGSFGRTSWIYQLNLEADWTPNFVPGLTLSAKVFNVLGAQHALRQDEQFDDGSGTPVPTFMKVTRFQDPRSFQLALRYDFF